MSDYQQLYKEVILKHHRQPFHYEKQPEAEVVLEAYNPVCGDQFQLYLTTDGSTIVDAYFHGYGCAISKAASSVLCQRLQGLPLPEVAKLVGEYMEMVGGEGALDGYDEELRAFAAAREFPERLSCATLSWQAVRQWLDS